MRSVGTDRDRGEESENLNLKRRSALKTSIGAGGLAATGVWIKPVVESVLLPAHAQLSEEDAVPSEPSEPGGPVCPSDLSLSASLTTRLEIIPPTIPDALTCDDTESMKSFQSGVGGQTLTIENNTVPAWSTEGDVFRLVFTNISADWGDAVVDVTRSISFANFDGDAGHPTLTQALAVGSPPGDETVMADGGGPVSFSDTSITLGNVFQEISGADWMIDVIVSFTSECGSTDIVFTLFFNEDFLPGGC